MKIGKQKKLIVILVILVLFLISAAFIIPKLLDINQYKGWIASQIEDAAQGDVNLGHITWGISNGIWLRTDTFSLTEASSFPVDLHLTNIYIKLAILPLLSKRLEIEKLTLDGPGVVVKLKPEIDETAVSDDKTSQEISSDDLGTLLPVIISVKKLSIQNGRIRIENGLTLPGQRLVHTFNAVKIEATDIMPGKKMDFHLSLEGDAATGMGSLQAQGSFKGLTKTFIIQDPKIKLNALISSLDTEIFKPYLKKTPLDNKLKGLVSLEINYEGDLLSHFNVKGSVNLTKTTYHDPSLWEGVLPGVETVISYQADVDPHDIRLEDLKIRIGNNTVNANALIKSWNEQPVIQDILLSSNLLPGELVPLIPWKLLDKSADKIRPVLEEGGQIEIETLSMGKIELTRPFPDPTKFLSGLGLTAKVSDISIPAMPGIPKLERVSGSLRLAEGIVNFKNFQLKSSSASIEKLNTRVDITLDRIKIADLSIVVVIPETDKTQSERFSIKLNGRIDDWQKEPVVLIRSLSTSPISLNPVVSMIPWEQIGDKADPVKKIFLAGGRLKISSLSLPGINLNKPPEDIKKVISKTKAAISISDIEIHPYPAFPVFEGISGNISMDKGVLNISEAQGRMGPVTFPSIKLQASGFNDDLQVTASLKGPIKVVGTDNKAIEKLLREEGFKSLTGEADIEMDFKYFQKQPEDWVAKGSLIIKGVNAESYPKGVHLDNLQGKVFFSRDETTELTVENLSAKINTAPVKLAGKLTKGRTSDMVINGKADIKGLDLAEFGSLLPYLDYLKLVGKLDLDLDFKIPYKHPADTQIDGTFKAGRIGFHLPDYNMVVKDTDIEIGLDSDSVQLTKMEMNINDQVFHLKGNASNPAEPKINLLVQSPSLDVDRLLPGDKKTTEPLQQKDSEIPETEPNKEEKDLKQALPSWAGNLTTDLRVDIERGKYHDQPFENLNLAAHYEKGLLQNYTVNLDLAKGKITTTGSADLRDPEKISFVINPDISNVQIGELSSLFKVEKMPLDGPLSMNGRLEGEAGDAKVLLSSLRGTLKADVGPGRIPEAKYLGKLVIEILNFANIIDLFSGALTGKMQNKGIPFKAIKSESTFNNGNMNLNHFIFISDSLNGNSQGVINFADEKIALQVVLEPLQTINKILNLVPVLGKQAKKLTNIYLMVEGPLDDPNVKTIYTKGFTDAIKGTLGIPGAVFKDPKELSGEIDEYMKEEAGSRIPGTAQSKRDP